MIAGRDKGNQTGGGSGCHRSRIISATAWTSSSRKRLACLSSATNLPHPASPQRDRMRPVSPRRFSGRLPRKPNSTNARAATRFLHSSGSSACRDTAGLDRQGPREPRGDDRLPTAAGALATRSWIWVVQRLGQELHQASGRIDVVLDLLPFDLPLLGQALDAIAIHPIGDRCPPPAHAVLDQGAGLPRTRISKPSHLAAAEIDDFLDLTFRQAVALGRRIENHLHIPLEGKRAGSEVVVDFGVLPAREQHANGAVDSAAGPTNLLVIGDDRTRR